ncbi:hypothetical protein NE237_004536 [Protea cynaroides]|uniref:Uncharacterized protein n=1 Tax=Protea cynaroides TaxID=273540 RepID=A0A9Q0KIY4_9MAGN|nr:hypothetical protein NE237_004536 [Protea cynaroides]
MLEVLSGRMRVRLLLCMCSKVSVFLTKEMWDLRLKCFKAQQVEDIIAHGEELPNKKEKSTFEAGGSSSRKPYSPRPFNPNPTPVSKGVFAVATQAPIVITRQENFAPPHPQKQPRQFTDLGMSRKATFENLCKVGLLAPLEAKPLLENKPRWFNPALFCK